MSEKFIINQVDIDKLLTNPLKPVLGRYSGDVFTATVIIPEYLKNVKEHYGRLDVGGGKGVEFSQFGLKISFNKAVELEAYDDEFILSSSLKKLISIFGLIIFENAYFSEKQRKDGQKNIFPSLAFHVDRGAKFENQFSLFVRDPFDEIQRHPRSSGTLIISNQVARLQGEKEGYLDMDLVSRYDLFTNEPVENYFGKIMAYQNWGAPEGVGEICIFDNRTVLHASYFTGKKGGYKIGVRYLY